MELAPFTSKKVFQHQSFGFKILTSKNDNLSESKINLKYNLSIIIRDWNQGSADRFDKSRSDQILLTPDELSEKNRNLFCF